jgi:hypothetical protein
MRNGIAAGRQKLADYAGKNRVAFGSAMVAVGLTLVGVAILLGG